MGIVSGAPNRDEGRALRFYRRRFHLVAITRNIARDSFLALRLGIRSTLRPRGIGAEFLGISATGRHVSVPHTALYDLEGDKITALCLYMPMDVFTRQLGALPEPVGAATYLRICLRDQVAPLRPQTLVGIPSGVIMLTAFPGTVAFALLHRERQGVKRRIGSAIPDAQPSGAAIGIATSDGFESLAL